MELEIDYKKLKGRTKYEYLMDKKEQNMKDVYLEDCIRAIASNFGKEWDFIYIRARNNEFPIKRTVNLIKEWYEQNTKLTKPFYRDQVARLMLPTFSIDEGIPRRCPMHPKSNKTKKDKHGRTLCAEEHKIIYHTNVKKKEAKLDLPIKKGEYVIEKEMDIVLEDSYVNYSIEDLLRKMNGLYNFAYGITFVCEEKTCKEVGKCIGHYKENDLAVFPMHQAIFGQYMEMLYRENSLDTKNIRFFNDEEEKRINYDWGKIEFQTIGIPGYKY